MIPQQTQSVHSLKVLMEFELCSVVNSTCVKGTVSENVGLSTQRRRLMFLNTRSIVLRFLHLHVECEECFVDCSCEVCVSSVFLCTIVGNAVLCILHL